MLRSQRRPAGEIAVVSPSPLMAETVQAALMSRHLRATIVPWSLALGRAEAAKPASERSSGPLLLVLDPPTTRTASAGQLVVTMAASGCVVVLGGSDQGPLWGAMLDAGADVVISATSSLDEVLDALTDLESARRLLDKRTRRLLIEDWHRAQARGGELADRVWSLTSRELEVLSLLYAGASVGQIAERTGVAVSTVRSHRKALMRKLGVSSQLAAVAAYERYLVEQDRTG